MKALTIRDASTAISAVTFRIAEALGDDYTPAAHILAKAGYGDPPINPRYVVLCVIDGGDVVAQADPFRWHNATLVAAHLHLVEAFDEVEHGQDLDVEAMRLALVSR